MVVDTACVRACLLISRYRVLACLVAAGALVLPAGAVAAPARGIVDPWAWSSQARSWAVDEGVLPAHAVARGASAVVTRDQFLAALVRVQDLRIARGEDHARQRLTRAGGGRVLADAPAGSARARSIALGWFTPRAGAFAPGAPVTADEAARATAAMLGLRPSVQQLAGTLRRELPGARVRWNDGAAQALARTIGLRYNVREPFDELELGPREPVNVAHAAYMLAAATRVSSWELDEARTVAGTFALPDLAAAQALVLAAAVRQLGQPYVWAGETEGMQAEGHGGFDCSGLVVRVVNHAGLPDAAYSPLVERTSMSQSSIPRRLRVARDELAPGDVMFFGDHGTRSAPSENFHAAVYMGNGWFIHSSGGNAGVAIDSLSGWWADRFAWGRRVLHAD